MFFVCFPFLFFCLFCFCFLILVITVCDQLRTEEISFNCSITETGQKVIALLPMVASTASVSMGSFWKWPSSSCSCSWWITLATPSAGTKPKRKSGEHKKKKQQKRTHTQNNNKTKQTTPPPPPPPLFRRGKTGEIKISQLSQRRLLFSRLFQSTTVYGGGGVGGGGDGGGGGGNFIWRWLCWRFLQHSRWYYPRYVA